jgi:hypothetical protein
MAVNLSFAPQGLLLMRTAIARDGPHPEKSVPKERESVDVTE